MPNKRKKLRLKRLPKQPSEAFKKNVKDTSKLIACNLELVLEIDDLKQILDNKDREILRLQSLLDGKNE